MVNLGMLQHPNILSKVIILFSCTKVNLCYRTSSLRFRDVLHLSSLVHKLYTCRKYTVLAVLVSRALLLLHIVKYGVFIRDGIPSITSNFLYHSTILAMGVVTA